MRAALVLAVVGVGAALLANCSSAPATAPVADAGAEAEAPQCREGGLGDASLPPAPANVPVACALPAQGCSPLDASSCGAGKTCDMSRLGDFQCAAAGPGKQGDSCDAVVGPFCGASLSCVAGRCAPLCCSDSDCGTDKCVPLGAMRASGGHVGTCTTATDAGTSDGGAPSGTMIGNHPGRFEGRGFLLPWTSWTDALGREMKWYSTACPSISGYPTFAMAVHLGGDCKVTIDDAIPAMQDATGIISYLKLYQKGNRADASLLATARALADYLIDAASTPNEGVYPKFPRSTGKALAIPQAPDCGTQKDNPTEVEPDKGAMAGHAYMLLFAETNDTKYANAALSIAQTLAATITPGSIDTAPWPFRVDYKTGAGRGQVNSNLSYALRLFDELLPTHPELAKARATLWAFIKTLQIPSGTTCAGQLWGEFFEDASFDPNRNAWAPLSLARYLLEKREALDPDWQADTETLLAFVGANFVDPDAATGFSVCIEQDFDRKPFGGIVSTYAAVLAMYAKATHSEWHRLRAYQSLTILQYAINDDGCPKDQTLQAGRGGWQEDAHTDKVHNLVDVFAAFPEWEN